MRREEKQRIDEQVRRAVEPSPAEVARLTGPDARRVMFDEIVSAAAPGDNGFRRTTPRRRRPVLVAAAGGIVWAATDRPAVPPVARSTSAPVVDATLNRFTASDLRFFVPLRPGPGAALARQPATLEAAFAEATATVVAKVTGVRPGRTLNDLQFLEVELEVTEVLRGALKPELNGVVRVEFTGAFRPDPIEPTVAAMRSQLPANPAVWLLRWQGEPPATSKPGATADDPASDKNLYRIVHPNCGVFAQGEDGVRAVTAQSESPSGAQREGEQFRTLSDLVAKAKA